MKGERKTMRLGDVTRMLSGATPFKGNAANWNGTIPWVSAKDMKRLYLYDAEDHITQEGLDNGSKLAPVGSTLILTRGMTLLNDVPICRVMKPLAFNQDVKALEPSARLDSQYLTYLLLALKPELLNTVEQAGHGTGKLPSELIKGLEVSLPVLDEQRQIASILGALDDKIELNRRMNATLEAMAQAVFKEWFVDGEMEGWEEKTIGELADIVGGSTPSTKEESYWAVGIHCWATPKDLSSLTVPVLLDTERHLSDDGLAEVGSGLLPVGTVLMSSRAPIGYIAITEVPTAVNQGFIALKTKPGISNLFLWQWVSQYMDEIKSRANGSTFQEISKANFRPITANVPPLEQMKAYDALVRPMYEHLVANERESRTLAALRDTLLPKLMRGEVRVKEPMARLKKLPNTIKP